MLSVPLTGAELKEMQEIVGVFLFYFRAVDPTMPQQDRIQTVKTNISHQAGDGTFLVIRKQVARRNNTYSSKKHKTRLPVMVRISVS